jgi:leucyl aminopeptidase
VCLTTLYISKKTGLKLDTEHWYEHVPKSVETSHLGKISILWYQQVQTARNIPNNTLEITIHDNDKGSCMLIDAVISGNRNVIKKESNKVLKYVDPTIEIQCMWNVKKVTSVITQATGTTSESLKQPFWEPYTHFGQYKCKSTKHSAREITLHVPKTVTTEQLQHYTDSYRFAIVCYAMIHINNGFETRS